VNDVEGLIAAIVADPKSDEVWRAYADVLVARNDPRGAWIRSSLESTDERVAWTPPTDDERFLSPRLAEHWHRLHFRWWRGFIRSVGLMGAMDDPPTFETIDALFADPHAALLSGLSISHPIAATVPLWRSVLAEPRPSITRFNACNLGDGGMQLDKLSGLEHLSFKEMRQGPPGGSAAVPVERIAHPSLKMLHAGATECPALLTGSFELPGLEVLVWDLWDGLELTDREHVPGLAVFEARESVLHRPPTGLRELDILGGYLGASIDMLAACPVVSQLRTLRWACGHDNMQTLAAVIAHAPQLRHLEALQIDSLGTPPIDDVDRWRRELEAALPNTRVAVPWDQLASRPREPTKQIVVDADSRDEDGRVNALARFTQSSRK
jgi:uncharacterized protein (TIGR02996 family)